MRPARAGLTGFGWQPLGRRAPVVSDLDLTIEPGERVLLVGPSGSGKTTLLRAWAGVLGSVVPGEMTGSVTVDGSVGLLLQSPGDAVVAARIGRDVAFGPENACVPRPEIWRRVQAALDAVRLPYGPQHPTSALSGGELQRLALAGVLAQEPGLLLLDEPTSMLDETNAAAVRASVRAVARTTGATLVVVEHHLEPWLDHVDRVVVLDADGCLVADTAPDVFAGQDPTRLARSGVWMPGLAPPEPVRWPDALVAPRDAPLPLRTNDLGVRLRTRTLRGPVTTQALRSVDADLPGGDLTAFTGPSGAGKSTLVAALAGLVAPTSGRIAGPSPTWHRWRPRDRAAHAGWVPQEPEHGFVTSTVRDEVAYTCDLLGTPLDVDAVLDAVGLSRLAVANPYQLSGGEQRRLALAAALAHRPGIVLLDEPTVGQDRGTWAAVVGWACSAAVAGAAVGVSTHDADLVALAGHQVPMAAGTVVG